MLLLVVAVLLGIAAGRARHPLGARSPRPTFTWLPLLGAGAALNLGAYVLDGTAATLALVASLATLLGFVVANPHVTGIAVIGLGLLLNLVAVVVNDGMPVRGSALVAAGVVDEHELATVGFGGARHLEHEGDPLPVLGDVLPVPLPVVPEVLSFGDLIIVFGAGDAVRDLARRRRRPWSTAERAAYRASLPSPGDEGLPRCLKDLPAIPPAGPTSTDVRSPGVGPGQPGHAGPGPGAPPSGAPRRPRVLVASSSPAP